MQVFDENWLSARQATMVLPAKGLVQIQVSGTSPVNLQGMRHDTKEGVPLKTGNEWRVRIKAGDFQSFRLSSIKKFGYTWQIFELQDGEPLNNENPPSPPLPGADNLVAQVQRIMRENSKANQAPYLDPEDMPFASRYEVEDDGKFEEDILADLSKARKEKQEAEKVKPVETPSVPEEQKQLADPPPADKPSEKDASTA